MNQKELLESAQTHCPELMQKTATLLAATEKLDEDISKEVLQDFHTITNFTSEKLASTGDYVKGMTTAMIGTAAAGLATAVATDLYDAASRGFTKARNFKRIMEANPDLKNYDKTMVRRSFDALHTYGPEFTADPLMGGSYLKVLAGGGGNEHQILKDLVSNRKNYIEAKAKNFSPLSLKPAFSRKED